MKQGRPVGSLARFTCHICKEVERVRGGSRRFICSKCRNDGFSIASGQAYASGQVHKGIRENILPHPRGLPCSDCYGIAVCYDHRDYNKPLSVDPVCRRCNRLRGPAIPRTGFFADCFTRGTAPYRQKDCMERIFEMLDIPVDLSAVPRRVRFEHWEPFKNALLQSERFAKKLALETDQ